MKDIVRAQIEQRIEKLRQDKLDTKRRIEEEKRYFERDDAEIIALNWVLSLDKDSRD